MDMKIFAQKHGWGEREWEMDKQMFSSLEYPSICQLRASNVHCLRSSPFPFIYEPQRNIKFLHKLIRATNQ